VLIAMLVYWIVSQGVASKGAILMEPF